MLEVKKLAEIPRPGKGWWTLGIALATVVVGQLMTWDWSQLFTDPRVAGWIVTVLGLATAVLRAMTDTPIGSAEPPIESTEK